MKRCVSIVILGMVGLTLSASALAEECRSQNLKGDYVASLELPFELPWITPIDPDLWIDCGKSRIRGTLNGYLFVCAKLEDVRYDLVNFVDIWGDIPGYIVASNYAVFSNRKGNIYFTQRTVIDVITGAQLGISEVEGGTGDYAGATGVLTWMPKWPGDSLRVQGFICTP